MRLHSLLPYTDLVTLPAENHWDWADPNDPHRQHAVVEDRIKALKATGASYLPFHSFDANAAWLELALAAHDANPLSSAWKAMPCRAACRLAHSFPLR